jgi:hypothetical protein
MPADVNISRERWNKIQTQLAAAEELAEAVEGHSVTYCPCQSCAAISNALDKYREATRC